MEEESLTMEEESLTMEEEGLVMEEECFCVKTKSSFLPKNIICLPPLLYSRFVLPPAPLKEGVY